MDSTIFIHYPPGARGDFLASALFDSFKPKEYGAVTRPVGYKYKNVHITNDYSFLDTPDTISIRIATGVVSDGVWNGNSIDPALQIVYNWMSKMPGHFDRNPYYMTMELPERYYHCAHFFLIEDKVADTHKYDHRVEFNNLNDLTYLTNLRMSIMGDTFKDDTLELMTDNINNQQHWSQGADAEMLTKVQQLIDSELKNGIYLGPTWDHESVMEKLERTL